MKKETQAIQPNASFQKKAISVKTQRTAMLFISAFFVLAVVCLSITLLVIYRNNVSLKAQESQVVDRYNKVAKEHENLVDPDYASVYFDGNNAYIPSDDIVIEYK